MLWLLILSGEARGPSVSPTDGPGTTSQVVARSPRRRGPPARGERARQARGGAPRGGGAAQRDAAVLHGAPRGRRPKPTARSSLQCWPAGACITASRPRAPVAWPACKRARGHRGAPGGGAARARAAECKALAASALQGARLHSRSPRGRGTRPRPASSPCRVGGHTPVCVGAGWRRSVGAKGKKCAVAASVAVTL